MDNSLWTHIICGMKNDFISIQRFGARTREKFWPLLRFVLCIVCVGGIGRAADPQSTPVPSSPGNDDSDTSSSIRFNLTNVEVLARQLAAQPYDNTANAIPEHCRAIAEEQWRSISFKPGQHLWQDTPSPFVIDLVYPGFVFDRIVKLNVVSMDGAGSVPFSADMFHTDDPALSDKLGDVGGFAGFSVTLAAREVRPAHIPADMECSTGIVGASHFLFSGRHASPGTYTRPAALNTALPVGEIPPYFREFWLVKPKPGDESLEFFALMDSPALTGAFRFVLSLGTSAVTLVESRLYRRKDAAPPEKLGLAPLTSMFLFSETQNGSPGDYRPEVHNADGLLVHLSDADGGWQWRPLANGQRLLVNSFPTGSPKGFGLMQRDTDFEHYQDLSSRYERKTSVWVEPGNDWGRGRIELVEIPASKEYHSNIMAFWVAEPPSSQPAPAAREDNADSSESPYFSCDYTVYWMPPGSSPHLLGRVKGTRMRQMSEVNESFVEFILDFEGGELDALAQDVGLTSVVEAPEEAPLVGKTLVKNPVTGAWRLTLRFRLPQNGVLQRLLAAREGPPVFRFKAYLKRGENLPDSLTETWVYDFVP